MLNKFKGDVTMSKMNKIVCLVATSVIISPLFIGSASAYASTVSGSSEQILAETTPNQDEVNFENYISIVEPYIYKAEDGTLQLAELPENIELLYRDNLSATRLHLQEMNKNVISGRMYTTDDLEYRAYRQTRSNTPQSFWWGYQYTFTNAEAKNFAKSMDDLAYGGLSVGAFVGAFGLGPIGPAIGTVSSLYWKQLANKVRDKNTSRGAIVKITRVAVFTVESR